MKILPKLFFTFLLSFFLFSFSANIANAQTVDLTQYVAGANFKEHDLTSGEHIKFEAGPGSGEVRMYKNANYEQFILKGDGIYRREDTSWAPLPNFQDAHCANGNKAAYSYDPGCTQYGEGQRASSQGVRWAIKSASVGQEWSTPGYQVLTVDSDASVGVKFCKPVEPGLDNYDYPKACNQSQGLLLEAYYPAGSFTFCSGLKNEDDLVKITTTGGVGAGDTFYFMKGWGLVQFEAPGFQAGLDGPGATSGCSGKTSTTSPTGQEVTISSSPIPEPYVACEQVRPDFTHGDTEFHSLRPYQASPCNQKVEQTVMYCGNNFYAKETYKLLPPDFAAPPGGGTADCTPWKDESGDGSKMTQSCTFKNVKSGIEVAIRLDPADLPILGNTQLVPNSINEVNALDNPTRMNQYVSWFLNGAVYQFEDKLPTTFQDILTFAGPLRKLLPELVQTNLRADQKASLPGARHDQYVTSTNRLDSVPETSKYAPFSSTEDRIGEVSAAQKDKVTNFGGNTFAVSDIVFTPSDNNKQSVDDIYFAHAEETASLAKFLQWTFASSDVPTFNEDNLYDFKQTPKIVNGFCDIKNSRTNPGDDLFGDYNDANNPNHNYEANISGNFSFTADLSGDATCNFTQTCQPGVDPETGLPTESCRVNTCERYAYVSMYVYTKSPLIKEIWQRLVSGKAGIVKRFFPSELAKSLKDIPASVKAIYDTAPSSLSSGDGTEAIAGSPYAPKSGDDALLFIPHLGSVQDYFLEGLQCAFRPKGMCGNPELTSPQGATLAKAPGACEINCDQSVPDSAIPSKYLALKDTFVDIANRWTGDGKNYAKECFNDTVRRSINAGVNPAFTLAEWLHESGASNYNAHNTDCTTQDFGVNDESIASNYTAQITRFLALPSAYKLRYDNCFNNGYTDMQNFMHLYLEGYSGSGQCIPTSDSNAYLQEVFNTAWKPLVPTCSFPAYPTSLSCP